MRIHELCQPCGDCGWCKKRWRWKTRSRELTKALKLLEELRWELVKELVAVGADEIATNATLRKKQRVADRAQKYAAKVKALR